LKKGDGQSSGKVTKREPEKKGGRAGKEKRSRRDHPFSKGVTDLKSWGGEKFSGIPFWSKASLSPKKAGGGQCLKLKTEAKAFHGGGTTKMKGV